MLSLPHFAVLAICLLGVSNSNYIGVHWNSILPNSEQCRTLNLICKCGKQPGTLYWKIPLCPNEQNPLMGYMLHGEFPNAEQYCAKFQNCKQCYPNGGRSCKLCPPKKTGRFCEKECLCRNGGSCNFNGECVCPIGFEGQMCERLRCGQPYSGKTPLIKYGNVSKIGQWPWQAALFEFKQTEDSTKYELSCGGSLLNERWVMTAAHCLTETSATDGIIDKEKIKVFLGKYYILRSKDDKFVQEHEIDEFHIHPNFNYKTFVADIALIKLKRPAQINSRVQPVCLPTLQTSERNLVNGNKGTVTGWGYNENDKLSKTLQQAELPVVTEKYCQQKNGDNRYVYHDVTESMFCAGYPKLHAADASGGDSGGPMVFLDPFSSKPRWVIEGIVSWGYRLVNDEFFEMGVYTKVSVFLNWVLPYIETSSI